MALSTRTLTTATKTKTKANTARTGTARGAALRTKDKAVKPAKSARTLKSTSSKMPKSARAGVKVLPSIEVAVLRTVTADAKLAPKAAVKRPEKLVDKGAEKQKAVRGRRPRHDLVASGIAEAMMGELGLSGEDSALARQAARSQREREILGRLAISMGRNDEMPNLELAADIVFADDTDAVGTLINVIERHDTHHGGDAARVLSEVGTRAPELLLHHADRLVGMIEDTQRGMIAYTMLALSPVASKYAEQLWDSRDLFWQSLSDLGQPADLAQAGAVRLLSALCAAGPDYARTLAGGLVDLLGKCMPKDVAFFAESVLPALGQAHSHRAKPVLDRRLKELTPAEVARLRRAQRAAQLGHPVPFAA